MANASTTGFGFRPIKKIGQNYNNAGLSEYSIASGSALISHACMVQLTANGVVLASGNTDENNLGVLNGSFYTDNSTSKPTFSNFSPASNTATDIVALVNDSPLQQYEIRSNNTGASAQTDVGNTADIAYSAGGSPNYVSGATLDDSTLNNNADQQVKIIGVSRDPENSDLTSANVVWRVIINQSFFLDTTGV